MVKGLVDLVLDLEKGKINFRSLSDGIDTITSAGRFFFHVMASLAQMDRELAIERTKAGLVAARKLGRVGGRRRIMTDSKVESARKLLAAGRLPKDVAADLGISVPTLYRWIPAAASIDAWLIKNLWEPTTILANGERRVAGLANMHNLSLIGHRHEKSI